MPSVFLSDADFNIQQGKNGKLLCHNIPSISLVLFYSQQCEYCQDVFPQFEMISNQIPGCTFAYLNILKFQKVAVLSGQTIAPITYVPFIILYVNGVPYMKYNGKKTANDIAKFVTDVLSRINVNQNFSNQKTTRNLQDTSTVPEYVNGAIPYNIICDAEQCYITVNEAYKPGGGR
jgi:thioredoxin-like negative regulator of GroEL